MPRRDLDVCEAADKAVRRWGGDDLRSAHALTRPGQRFDSKSSRRGFSQLQDLSRSEQVWPGCCQDVLRQGVSTIVSRCGFTTHSYNRIRAQKCCLSLAGLHCSASKRHMVGDLVSLDVCLVTGYVSVEICGQGVVRGIVNIRFEGDDQVRAPRTRLQWHAADATQFRLRSEDHPPGAGYGAVPSSTIKSL